MKVILILLLCLLPTPLLAQEPKPRMTAEQRKAARERRAEEREAAKAKIEAGLKDRAAIFDLQFYTGSGPDMQTFEINTVKGSYRYEHAKEKKLIEGSGAVRVDGCTITLTDWPRVVATANVCSGTTRAYIDRYRLMFSLVGEEECEECSDEEDEDSDSQ